MTGEAGPARGRWGLFLTAGVAAVIIALDQVTKAAIVATIGPDADRNVIWVMPPVLRFLYVRNTGVAFGAFQGAGEILILLAVGVVLLLAVAFWRMIRESPWLSLALGLQFGGAIGNIIDRLRYGYVVDFIDVPNFPTFNVADSAITVGVILLGIYLLRTELATAPQSPIEPPQAGVSGSDEGGSGSARPPSG
ncbi:signal peptidase II [Sphaerobacter thermophilus]|uniref:Lipoprotein signal peptidase n=1 Tax=Sphaerobacter thermophilus (strain ATCC 49802 / DSM 20745 / KCCM 41009 / NCIMB 13125 / S 6022) TaxID=479434 RepID=D1C121_SPHTD|nr:signal peptidase II [Sphaerobacter thermophilus]ACZ37938.1 lipoprotein signal peptidase [Sphaerobacter thermophilus DSM 20745]